MKIDTHFFDDKKVLIFGFGTNGGGLGTASFLLGTKAKKIIITDQKEASALASTKTKLPSDPRVTWSLGIHKEEDFLEADIIIKNPNIPWDHSLLVKAKEHGAEVLIDAAIFMALCSAPVLGVTGSKGKTTTASLLVHILTEAGKHVVPVGISQTGVLSELEKVENNSVVVFELSSWRLSGLQDIQKSPHIAIVTNLYPDHLNYYGTLEEYAKDKKIIAQFQGKEDFFIVPAEGDWTPFFTEGVQSDIKIFGKDDASCAWQDDDALWCWWTEGDTEPSLLLKKEKSFLQGEHLFENMLAAALAAKVFGIEKEIVQKALASFTGVPHRFELVREVAGVRYINDTTATIPTAALASVRSVSGPVILLAGGSDKGLPLEDLAEAVSQAKFSLLFQGSGTDILISLLRERKKENYEVVASMQEAIQKAKEHASSGDTVLLAPGAASFGMFVNEFDRGNQFMQGVTNL